MSTPPNMYMSTTFDAPGYRVTRPIGLVWGTLVRSVGFGRSFTGGFKALRAGEVGEFSNAVDEARRLAVQRLAANAAAVGANAILGVRFESADIGEGLAEVMAYGTAVVVEPDVAASA
ncbi:MAG: heavy metal-binding domain-containing protein [Jiangellales bacterium]